MRQPGTIDDRSPVLEIEEANALLPLVRMLASRIEREFQLSSFPLALIFEHPTVSEQATLVESMLANRSADSLVNGVAPCVDATTASARRRLRGRQAVRF